MRRRHWRRYAAALLLACVAGGTLPAAQAQSNYPPPPPQSRYILEGVPGVNITGLAAKYQFTVLKSFVHPPEAAYSIVFPQPPSPQTLKQLGSEPGVREVEANTVVASAESDSHSKAQAQLQSLGNLLSTRQAVNYFGASVLSTYVTQPATQMIELSQALNFGTGKGIVAIIDTGVDPGHPALQGALVPGYDFTRNRSDTWSELFDLSQAVATALQQSTVELLDKKQAVIALTQSTVELLDQSTVELLDGGGLPAAFGHGTMVAGLVHLVAPGAKIMPLKAFRSDGSADIYDIANAVRYAADNGASVISMSFSYDTPSTVLQSALAYAIGRHVICVASSGNQGIRTSAYPASWSAITGVGSVNFSDRRSPFSNYGPSASTSAPGEAVITIYPGGNYAAVWGTSFSAALVSGAVALMNSVGHGVHGELGDALEAGVQIDQGMGDGRLDVLRSILYLQTHH